jgi:hypothetical protein
MVVRTAILALLVVTSPVAAAQDGAQKPKELPPADRQMLVSINAGNPNVLVLEEQMTLARMGYLSGPFTSQLDAKTKAALREYQKRSAIPIIDTFDLGTYDKLEEDSKALDSPVDLPMRQFSDLSWESGYASVEGTWASDSGTELAFAVSTSSLTCIKSIGYCFHASAVVFEGRLTIDNDFLEIEHWDSHEILTKPNDALCVRSTIRIAREQKTATETRTIFKIDGPCANLGLKVGDEHLHIEDGPRASEKLKESRRKVYQRVNVVTRKAARNKE